MVVQRIYLRHPEIVTHIITVCTAFRPPIRDFIPMEKEVELIPTFKLVSRLTFNQSSLLKVLGTNFSCRIPRP